MTRTSSPTVLAALGLTAVLLLAACGSDEPSASEPAAAVVTAAPESPTPTEDPSTAPSATPTTVVPPADSVLDTGETMANDPSVVPPPSTSAVELAEWQTTPMIDVDGQAFAVADFVGRPVLVETFATWCKNCRDQLEDTQGAAAVLGDDAVVLALSVETDLSSGDVADYADDNGFTDIRFAVMTPEALAAFVDAFGNTVVNPPSTPKIVVDAMGHAGELSTGAESSESIVEQLGGAVG